MMPESIDILVQQPWFQGRLTTEASICQILLVRIVVANKMHQKKNVKILNDRIKLYCPALHFLLSVLKTIIDLISIIIIKLLCD